MVTEIFSLKYLVLFVFILSSLYIHFRGWVRYRLARQLMGVSTLMAPCLLYWARKVDWVSIEIRLPAHSGTTSG